MLNIDPIVKVQVRVGTSTASVGVFDVGAIMGTTPVAGKFDSAHRYKEYTSLKAMEDDGFSTGSAEYMAAAKYFGVNPAPAKVVMIYYFSNPVAEEYDATATYEVGDYCTHENKLYQCNTAISTAEEWNSAHWTEVTTVDELPSTALLDAIDKGAQFYAVYYIPKAELADSTYMNNIASIASVLDAQNRGVVFYGYVGTVASAVVEGGIFDSLKVAKAKRAIGMYCTASIDDAAGMMGEAMGLAKAYPNEAFALCYKTIASATVNDLTQEEVMEIKAVNGNVYVQRTRERSFIETGIAAGGMRFDEIMYIDRMAYEMQIALYELIADSVAKLPQNDATTTLFISAIHGVLENYYDMRVLDTAIWRGDAIDGMIEPGDYVEHGHAEFAQSFDLQSEADRIARKSMTITVLLCLSGAVESVVVSIDVQT